MDPIQPSNPTENNSHIPQEPISNADEQYQPQPGNPSSPNPVPLTPAAPAPVPAPAGVGMVNNQPVPVYTPPQRPQAAPQPAYNNPASPNHEASVNSAGLIVLQWLTYAFWGWTILAVSILVVTVLANFINDVQTGGFTPYGIAAVLVLLPISIACDVFYSKKEPQKKTGAASIVMVIHAVIFALFGIGALIALVFSLVTMFTTSSDNSGVQVAIFSSIIIAILYGAVFLRTLNPKKLPFIRRFFIIFMTLAVGAIALLGIIGPVANERVTRNDRLISSNLSPLKTEIDSYANEKNKLPSSLNDLDLTGDTKILVEKDLVKYTPNSKLASVDSAVISDLYSSNTKATYFYQLCVTYTKEHKSLYGSSRSNLYDSDHDGYVTYIDTYGDHGAGEKCYKVSTSPY